MINQDLEQENEYFNRKMYFRTVFESYNIKWEIGNLAEYWYGTEAEHTIELKKYLDKGLKVLYEHLNEEVDYGKIRLALAFYKKNS